MANVKKLRAQNFLRARIVWKIVHSLQENKLLHAKRIAVASLETHYFGRLFQKRLLQNK